TSDELLIGPDGVTLTWNSDNSGMHLENGALKAYTDVIAGNAPGNAGIPYYQQKLDDFAAAFGELMNNTIHEDDGTAVFKTLIEAEGGGALTAGNISVSTAWAEDPSYVIRDQNPDGTLDNTDIMKLKAGLAEERTFGKEYKYSGNFSGFITNYTDTLGSDIKTTKARLNASLAIAESVEKDRQGVSGVSLNEEGINLMTYNKAYQALGRLMTTMDEQLDMIINQMGMVGR
ncbi:flagellar basal body rod C-terminal domain-containing protein, partial [Eisenbergiella tayi]